MIEQFFIFVKVRIVGEHLWTSLLGYLCAVGVTLIPLLQSWIAGQPFEWKWVAAAVAIAVFGRLSKDPKFVKKDSSDEAH